MEKRRIVIEKADEDSMRNSAEAMNLMEALGGNGDLYESPCKRIREIKEELWKIARESIHKDEDRTKMFLGTLGLCWKIFKDDTLIGYFYPYRLNQYSNYYLFCLFSPTEGYEGAFYYGKNGLYEMSIDTTEWYKGNTLTFEECDMSDMVENAKRMIDKCVEVRLEKIRREDAKNV